MVELEVGCGMKNSQSQFLDGSLSRVFAQGDLGDYAKITFYHRTSASLSVIYDKNAEWIMSSVRNIFSSIPDVMSLDEVKQVLHKIKREYGGRFGLSRESQQRETLYFDDITSLQNYQDVLLVLAAKQLLDCFTKIESRIICLGLPQSGPQLVLAIRSKGSGCIRLFDPTQTVPEIDHEAGDLGLLLNRFSLLENKILIQKSQEEWTNQKKSFSLFGEIGQELNFQIMGRTPAEKRFDREADIIQNASPDQLVPIEINYHPFWRPLGHTTLRVGKHLYELSATGWKAHNSGANTARAFIFNNPFFRKQLKVFADKNIAPMSIGVTLMVAKSKVDVLLIILENLAAAQGPSKEKFSLIKNNCNQGIVRVLTQAGIEGFDHKGYLEFSTVLTYRQILLNPLHPVEGLRIYPLPNTQFTQAEARRWVPTLLYRSNSVSRELMRALPIFPADFFYLNWKRVLAYFKPEEKSHENA